MSTNNGQQLAGKVAVVTGGSRGIGAAIARRLATRWSKCGDSCAVLTAIPALVKVCSFEIPDGRIIHVDDVYKLN